MILRPNYCYSFLRTDPVRYKKEREDANIKYPYIGEILSDSWGEGKEPKDRLLWDEDWNSADFWEYENIYPELIAFINMSVTEGFIIDIAESYKDPINPKAAPTDYKIKEPISKLDDAQWTHLVEEDKKLIMSSPYGQFFAHLPHRAMITEEKLCILKGIPFIGDKEWRVGDVYLHCMVEEVKNDERNLTMKTLSHRHIKDVECEYDYVRMCSHIPVFKKREAKNA
jgi:hypothetical protein